MNIPRRANASGDTLLMLGPGGDFIMEYRADEEGQIVVVALST